MKNIYMSVVILILLIVIMVLPSCEKKSFISKYDFIYGEWVPTSVESFYRIDLKSFGNRIQLIEDHFYKIFRNDTLIEKGDIFMDMQTDIQLVISFVPKEILFIQKYTHMDRSPLEVTCFSNDSIRMANNYVDGGYFCIYLVKKD